MGLIDRFTRDEVSAQVWWPIALLFIVLAVGSFRMESRSVVERRSDATAWSADVIRERLEPSLASSDLTLPLGASDAANVTAALTDALAVEGVDAVRLWAVDGTLLYSSVAGDPVGSQEALNDTELEAAADDPASPLGVIAERSPTGERIDPLFLTYATLPSSPASIGEVQMTEGALLADVTTMWQRIRVLFVVSALLLLALALLSMREPVAPIGAGVRFYASSVPASLVVIDREEEAMPRQAGAQGRRRSESVDRRIEALEASKLALEGELQRALSSLAALRASMGVPPMAIPPAPTAASPAARMFEGSLADIDGRPDAPREVERPDPTPLPDAPVRLRAVREPEPEPVVEVAPAPEPERVVVEAAAEPLPDLVVLPEADPVPVSAETADADAESDAVDVLNRLVAPLDADRPTVDPKEIRAKLARTAALKKPGSRERREEEERRAQGHRPPR